MGIRISGTPICPITELSLNFALRVKDALPLDHDLDLLRRQAKQPYGLDQFQTPLFIRLALSIVIFAPILSWGDAVRQLWSCRAAGLPRGQRTARQMR